MKYDLISKFNEGNLLNTHVSSNGRYAAIKTEHENNRYLYSYDIRSSRILGRYIIDSYLQYKSLNTGQLLIAYEENNRSVDIVNGGKETVNTFSHATISNFERSILGGRFILTEGDELFHFELFDIKKEDHVSFELPPKIYNGASRTEFSVGNDNNTLAFVIGDKRLVLKTQTEHKIISSFNDDKYWSINGICSNGEKIFYHGGYFKNRSIGYVNANTGKVVELIHIDIEDKNRGIKFIDISYYNNKIMACYKEGDEYGIMVVNIQNRKSEKIKIPKKPIYCNLYKNVALIECYGSPIYCDLNNGKVDDFLDKISVSKKNGVFSNTKSNKIEFYQIR